MMKIQRNSNFQTFFPTFLATQLEKQHRAFLHSDLGKIYQAIPWQKLVKHFKRKDNTKGPTNTFPPQGKIALMFLKVYSQTSDRKLMAQINGKIHYQYFCGIRLEVGQQLTNHKIISQIRCELAQKLKIQPLQSILARH